MDPNTIKPSSNTRWNWLATFGKKGDCDETNSRKWTMGILEDKETIEVPGNEDIQKFFSGTSMTDG